MRIACCISGLPSPRIIEHLNNLVKYRTQFDFFIFFWDTINADIKQKINNLLNPKAILYQKPVQFPFDARYKEPDKPDHKNNSFSMFYGIAQVQQLRQAYELKTGIKYDIVIRFRYDLYFFDDLMFTIKQAHKLLINNCIVCPFDNYHIGICDQLWFGHSDTMNKFTNLLQWIQKNLDTLYYVNESVLYKFIKSNNIEIKCLNIRFKLIRDQMLRVTERKLLLEYEQHKLLPWMADCPERTEGYYQKYLDNNNESSTNIYFITKCCYQDITCRIINNYYNKYICVNEQCDGKYRIKGDDYICPLIIHVSNASLINIKYFSPIQKNYKCLTSNNTLTFGNNDGDVNARFFLIKKEKTYQIILSSVSEDITQKSKKYLIMDKNFNMSISGSGTEPESWWRITEI